MNDRLETEKGIKSLRKLLKSPPPESEYDCMACEINRIEQADDIIWLFVSVAILTILAIAFIFFCLPSKAHAYTEEQAIRTIIGESANQGLIGMTAVAEVIRTKGSLKGLYGYKNPCVDKQPKWVWKQAKKAWEASKTSHLTKGADHFENIKAFGCPYWSKNCVVTFQYKDHVFMKEAV